MADDPIINDEQAFSYAENMVNWSRGLRHLEAVCRYVRDAKKQVTSLTTSRDALRNDVEEARKLLSETQKSISKFVTEESDLSAKVAALKQEMDRIEKTLPSLLRR